MNDNSVRTVRETTTAWAPASVSNLGPGFDCLGMAVQAWGDRVTATRVERPGVSVTFDEASVWKGPTDEHVNTAAVAAASLLRRLDSTAGVHLSILKGIRAGTGLGSSASSAVAGAMATAGLMGADLDKRVILEAALDGEAAASGARHGDNVLPALYGGIVLSPSDDPRTYKRIKPVFDVFLAVVLPDVEVLTKEARDLLPPSVPLADAVRHASRLGLLVHALLAGAATDFGRAIMTDTLIEPLRAELVGPYAAIRSAALRAGAHGVALSGSGPAMFAVCRDADHAKDVAGAMKQACVLEGVSADVRATVPDATGARMEVHGQ